MTFNLFQIARRGILRNAAFQRGQMLFQACAWPLAGTHSTFADCQKQGPVAIDHRCLRLVFPNSQSFGLSVQVLLYRDQHDLLSLIQG
jgi:hypothetical protein